MKSRYGVVDVHYGHSGEARAALAVFGDVGFSRALEEYVTTVSGTPEYQPGYFYKREMPGIEAVLRGVPLTRPSRH